MRPLKKITSGRDIRQTYGQTSQLLDQLKISCKCHLRIKSSISEECVKKVGNIYFSKHLLGVGSKMQWFAPLGSLGFVSGLGSVNIVLVFLVV